MKLSTINDKTDMEFFKLAVARLFCRNVECPHYNVECSDGHEDTFVLCPDVAKIEMMDNPVMQ